MGVFFLLAGAVVFVRFLRRHPLPSEAHANEVS